MDATGLARSSNRPSHRSMPSAVMADSHCGPASAVGRPGARTSVVFPRPMPSLGPIPHDPTFASRAIH